MTKIFNGKKFVKIDEVYLEDEFFSNVCQSTIPPTWNAYAGGHTYILCDGYNANTSKEAMAAATHFQFK